MRQVFFNSFKEKILRGDVPSVMNVSGIPVNSKFMDAYDNDQISIEQYRTLSDFETYSKNVQDMPDFSSTLFEYSAYDVDYSSYEPDDLSEKPLFVSSSNSAEFFRIYSSDIDLSDEETSARFESYLTGPDPVNTNSGFYYVLKKSHLHWLADRCNDPSDFNNKINIVLGDDIGNVNDRDELTSMICPTPERPFQGVLDLNGHKIINKTFICDKNSNGLVGYLGTRGVVRNGIVESINFRCDRKISLEKIVRDCTDVVAGCLVGTNYGTVENIVTSGEMRFDGFCPEVYLVGNKYEYRQNDDTSVNSAFNAFFPNKLCMNSIYNVIPYVGYFAEGADSFYNDVGDPTVIASQDPEDLLSVTSASVSTSLGLPLCSFTENSRKRFLSLDHYMEGKMSISDGYDQSWIKMSESIPSTLVGFDLVSVSNKALSDPTALDKIWSDVALGDYSQLDYERYQSAVDPWSMVRKAVIAPFISTEDSVKWLDLVMKNTISSIGQWTSFNGEKTYEIKQSSAGSFVSDVNRSSYLCQQIRDTITSLVNGSGVRYTPHQRMAPGARIAYYCSPVVGNNFGTIRGVDCRHTLVESIDTFVGFIGGVCGRENYGDISRVSSVIDIAPSSGAQNISRSYTKRKQYRPQYSDTYGNLVNVFAYNWDYWQSPWGLKPEELPDYSAHSADCVEVSERFYDFHDFLYSGVNYEAYSRYCFNKFENKSSAYTNCNFLVTDSGTSEDIGKDIPQQIRAAKMTFGQNINGEVPTTFRIAVQASDDIDCKTVAKIYDSWDENRSSCKEKRVTVYGATASILTQLSFDVEHFEMSYLGDAAKTFQTSDTIGGMSYEHEQADGSEYTMTLDQVMTLSPAFSGECGLTKDNCIEFADNIMRAKVAMGAELLANSAVSVDVVMAGNDEPFKGSENPGVFGTTNRRTDEDPRDFIIPAGTWPNNTDEDWNIFDDENNGPDMAWYMPPASSTYEKDGPTALSTKKTGTDFADKATEHKNLMNSFCSIKEDGKWDLYLDNMPSDGVWKEDLFTPSIHRTMITIEPRQTVALDVNAKTLVRQIESLCDILSDWEGSSIEEKLGLYWSAKINRVYIPLANRTQHGNAQSSTFCGLLGTSGVFIKETESVSLWSATVHGSSVDLQTQDPDIAISSSDSIGNLSDMYVDVTIAASPDGVEKRNIPLLLKIPLKSLYVPISAVSASYPTVESVDKCTFDLANWRSPSGLTTKVRDVKYYPLVPAYDVEETNGALIDYRLKSIYNVGGVAGMINHSVRYAEYGNHGEASDTFDGVNRAECGSISDVVVTVTSGAVQFMRDAMELQESSSGTLEPKNDRSIGVANKFAGVAPVYEYHQDIVGTSFPPGVGDSKTGVFTNGLMRMDAEAQTFKIDRVTVLGSEDLPLSAAPSKLFKPIIEWANVSNILDTVDFFEKRWTLSEDRDLGTTYTSYQCSNWPEMTDVLFDTSCNDVNTLLVGPATTLMASSAYPALSPTQMLGLVSDKDAIGLDDLTVYGAKGAEMVRDAGREPIRSMWTKRYDYLPNHLIRLTDVFYSQTGSSAPEVQTEDCVHMGLAANAPSSEYSDIYLPMYCGSPALVFTKLYKPMILAPLYLTRSSPSSSPADESVRNQSMIDLWNERAGSGPTDRWFTWDYTLSLRDRPDPLNFVMRYARAGSTRGLWIHQIIPAVDSEESIVRYEMADGIVNDGSRVQLGYMPSSDAIVGILNRRAGDGPQREGVAISGEDFRGVLLVDPGTGELICMIDAQTSRDFDGGCYAAELEEKIEIDGQKYGLLTAFETEENR